MGFTKADNGEIKMIDSKDESKIEKDRIGYIPENVNLYPYLSGIENLNDYFSKIANLNFSKKQLEDISLVNCGLEKDSTHKLISEYSKGMRQKVGIAIAYAKKPKFIF